MNSHRRHVVSSIEALVAIALLQLISESTQVPLLIAPFGATVVLLFALPDSPLCFQSLCGRLPRIAQDLPRTVPLDLSNEYLDSDFLSRIEMMHTAQTEYSVGKTWFPINLFGV